MGACSGDEPDIFWRTKIPFEKDVKEIFFIKETIYSILIYSTQNNNKE